MKPTIRGLVVALLVVASSAVAGPNDTNNVYDPTIGSRDSVKPAVILQSSDGLAAEPINSTHPLPVTSIGGTAPTPPTGVNATQVNGAKTSSATVGSTAVATTSTAVLSANATRINMILVNDSDADMYVCFAATCTASTGVRLNALGGSVSDWHYTGAVSAIHASSGTKTLARTEY